MLHRIGDHLLDTDRFELTHAGEPVPVEPQVFLVLAYLVEHRDRLVTKEELLDEVWNTRFVTESSLTSRIKSARRALGDDGRTQDRIRTVRGQGFRFVGPVETIGGESEGSATPAAGEEAPPDPGDGRLPRWDSPLRGRDDEVAEVGTLLDGHGVLTLVGPGGTGKTRLAVAVARQEHRGLPAGFVDLATVRSPEGVAEQLAAALGIQTGQRAAILTACCEYLSAVPHLLVIDNCEHVVDGAAEVVAAIAAGNRRCRLLCTSREPLRVPDEQVFRVGPLPTVAVDAPATATAVLATASGALFAERARRGDHLFEVTEANAPGVARLCRELDGLPLAIELAAGRLSALSLDDLLDRLDRRLDLLGSTGRSVDDRHRTLRATVEWSYDTLEPDAQRLLRYLAAFPAGAMLETVEAIAHELDLATDPLDLVTGLVDASLLQRQDSPHGARYVQLETVRAFGSDRLEHHDEVAHAADLQADWALDLVARMDAELVSDAEVRWADRIRQERSNLRAARQHLVAAGRVDDLVALLSGLHEWTLLRDASEVASWAEDLLATVADRDDAPAARVHVIAAQGAWRRGDHERSRANVERALELERRHPDVWCRARAKSVLGVTHLFAGDLDAATDCWLARVELDPSAVDLANAALAAAYTGDVGRARELATAARQLAADRGAPTWIAWTAYVTGEVEHQAGSAQHVTWLERAVEAAEAVGSDFTLGVAQVTLATSQAASGDAAVAAGTYRRLIEHWLRDGSWTQLWTTLRNAAVLLEPHAPDVALSIVLGADADPFSPALSPEAARECEALRDRLAAALGEDRAREVGALVGSTPRLELAHAARDALQPLLDLPAEAAVVPGAQRA